ncbi:hypothetical protein CP975_22135 [Streptomyces alboniger]|uniref:Uncharacterized protein n=1 Tax=Streptomyces alboniger TaxID=132473 RepID=A0A5J6HNJ3_STRAD|nr:hypothetical protein CP975_22135 [Streptomyces alboniger]
MPLGRGDRPDRADHVVEFDDERRRLLGQLGGDPALADAGRAADQQDVPGWRDGRAAVQYAAPRAAADRSLRTE